MPAWLQILLTLLPPALALGVAWRRRPVAMSARTLAIIVLVWTLISVGAWFLRDDGMSIAPLAWIIGLPATLAFGLLFRPKSTVLVFFSAQPTSLLAGLLSKLYIASEADGASLLLPKYTGRLQVIRILPTCYWVSLSAERVTPKIELLIKLMRKFLANPESV